MNTLKKLFYFTYAVAALVIIGILFFKVSLTEMFGEEGTSVFWMTIALLLLSLLTVGVIGDYAETRSLSKKLTRLEKENTDLKARLYEKLNPLAGEAFQEGSPPNKPSWLNRLGLGKGDLANRPKTDN
jgi:type VI protein secretion system component VasK